MTEVELQQAPQNGIDLSAAEDDDNSKSRPADIEQDMREMERRKRVEAIMSSKLFREELERIVDSAREGGTSGILQQLSDIVGVPASRVGSVFKTSNCMVPINDIRGVESMGYAKGEKILRCKLAATFRLLDLYGWTQGLGALISARLKVDQEYFLVNPYGLMFHEITASSLNKVDMQGNIVEQGTTNFGVNKGHFILHSVVHAARPDIRCAIYIGCSPVVAISSLKTGLLPITKDACVLGEITTHAYTGSLDNDERDKLVRNLGPISKVMLLSNHGALCCGETIEEAFFAACHIVQACETQLKLLPVGLDNLVLIPEESRKHLYDQSRRPPEDLEKKFAAALNNVNATSAASQQTQQQQDGEQNVDETAAPTKTATNTTPKWRVGGAEFEALMRMLDNAGYRTGYIYRHPLIKSDPPKPKNDVELPPAVSSLGYLLEEEELFKQGIWKKGDIRKGGDRSRWLNSPNVYQKVEVLETGTPDPKKITKWVAEGSPTHSTPVRIEDPLQFVPANTNPKEFKRLQQQIKDNRRADKISAGPQSHILEGVTWDEANRIKDATVSQTGDHVVLMGAASKGIIQRGFQHNATVYKAPYAKNPFDNVTDDELNEYKRTVERKKKSIHGEYTDTDFSESEALSSQQTSGAQQTKQTTTSTTAAAVSQSEPEDISEHQVMRIETQQAPVPSQPEVVLSDAVHNKFHLTTNVSQIARSHQDSYLCLNENLLELKQQIISRKLKNILMARKYKFLYEKPRLDYEYKSNFIIQTIHKIEVYPNHTYPTMNNTTNNSDEHHSNPPNNDNSLFIIKNQKGIESSSDQSSSKTIATTSQATTANSLTATAISALQPYRTVSHYGFNYPLTYMPTISLHPSNLLSSVEEQRQKVIAYIRKTAISYAQRQHSPEMVKKYIEKFSKKEQNEKPSSCNDSFVSFKEIQLTPKSEKPKKKGFIKEELSSSKENSPSFDKKLTSSTQILESGHDIDVLCKQFSSLLLNKKLSPSPIKKLTSLSQTSELEHDIDGSEQFSSLLSISGIYPTVTVATPSPSHTQSCDQEQHDYDSGDNYSSLTAPPRMSTAASENLYRSYFLRNFLPLRNHSMNLNNSECQQNHDEHHTEHNHNHPDDEEEESQYEKPEAEQNMHSNDFHTTGDSAIEIDHYPLDDKQKHFKLTLNTKRNRNPSARRRIRMSSSSHDEAPSCSSSFTNASNTSSAKTLEIHVNITIKNSDCAKTLHAHEQEFKSKLENVIDNEIQLIADQLAFSQYVERKQQKSSPYSIRNQGKIFERRSSAPEMDLNNNDMLLKSNKISFHNKTNPSNPCHQPYLKDHKRSLRKGIDTPNNYQDALYVLEQELETLLNNIIRSNELHNRAIMCSCKTKISQITENIKNTLNHTSQ